MYIIVQMGRFERDMPSAQRLHQIAQAALPDVSMIHVLMTKKPGDCGAGLSYCVTLVSIRRGAD
ncbi:hypothetical protein [Hoeflea sp.]|uniref:hypothetical protein n=1 Tax=Hoeflea sp. TaxID=1940281 RepID=UPI003A94A38C